MTTGRASRFDGARALMLIHLVLVLLLPFLFTQMGGCQGELETVPLNLGTEVSPEELDRALSIPLESTTPLSIQLGEGFVVSETQELGVGGGSAVLSDTSQSVIERQENTAEVLLTLIEHKQTYLNGEIRKTSTEIPVRIEKSSSPTVDPQSSADPLMFGPLNELPRKDEVVDRGVAAQSGTVIRAEVDRLFRDRSPRALLAAVRAEARRQQSAMAASSGELRTFSNTVSYHGLKTSVAMEAPPELVRRRPNCAGIPDCKLKVYRVSFDMVFWEAGKPDRVHWDLEMSPEAPYLAAILNKCITGLASLGGNQGDILVKQCLPVIDFRYVQ